MVVSRFAAVVAVPIAVDAVAAARSSFRAVTIGVGSWRGKNRLMTQPDAPSVTATTRMTANTAPTRLALARLGTAIMLPPR